MIIDKLNDDVHDMVDSYLEALATVNGVMKFAMDEMMKRALAAGLPQHQIEAVFEDAQRRIEAGE